MTGEMFPVIAVERVDPAEVNRLLVEWAHPLGACERPFHQDAHVLIVHGRATACTMSASTVSATCGGMDRETLVELARIARRPDAPWALRTMLRLWRDVLAHLWPSWPVAAAVSYAMPGTPGSLYRFDGWERVGCVAPSSGGGTWSSKPKVNAVADGVKTLWRYVYPTFSFPRVEAPHIVDMHLGGGL